MSAPKMRVKSVEKCEFGTKIKFNNFEDMECFYDCTFPMMRGKNVGTKVIGTTLYIIPRKVKR